MADQLSTLYGDLLQGSYDCVDRVILNAYFTMGRGSRVEACARGGVRCTVPMTTWTTII